LKAYHSVAEILDSISGAHDRLYSCVAEVTAEQENFRPAADAWTVGEIVEHLGIVSGQFLRLTHKLLAQAEAQGAQASADLRIGPVSLARVADRWQEKFTAPESAQPRGSLRIAESVAHIRQAHEGLTALRPRLEAADLSQVSLPHPAFGPLNLYEWLVLIGEHEDRHLGQIQAVKASPGFPA
jgi:hypothetical protein